MNAWIILVLIVFLIWSISVDKDIEKINDRFTSINLELSTYKNHTDELAKLVIPTMKEFDLDVKRFSQKLDRDDAYMNDVVSKEGLK